MAQICCFSDALVEVYFEWQDMLLHAHLLRTKVQRVRISVNSSVERAVICKKLLLVIERMVYALLC